MKNNVKGDYVLVYKGGAMPATEAEGRAVAAAWTGWYATMGEAIVDPGNPFGPSRSVASDGTVKDATSGFTGYTIVKADDIDAALTLAKGCPVLRSGGSVEVYETFFVPGDPRLSSAS